MRPLGVAVGGGKGRIISSQISHTCQVSFPLNKRREGGTQDSDMHVPSWHDLPLHESSREYREKMCSTPMTLQREEPAQEQVFIITTNKKVIANSETEGSWPERNTRCNPGMRRRKDEKTGMLGVSRWRKHNALHRNQ